MSKMTTSQKLAWPGLIWFMVFLVVPLFIIGAMSIGQRGSYGGIEYGISAENFVRLWDAIYLNILWNSLKMSFLTTVFCWTVGIVVAWFIGTSNAQTRNLLLVALAIPSLTNLVVRIYAINNLASPQGLLAQFFLWINPQFDTFKLTQNIWITYYGLVTTYLPFMIFPLIVAIEKFDFSTLEAAQDLGAKPLQLVLKVILPQLKSASLTGAMLVFIPCLGEYLIPDLLGGAKVMMAGNLISDQFLKARDWPFGSAIAIVLLLSLGISLYLIEKIKQGRKWS